MNYGQGIILRKKIINNPPSFNTSYLSGWLLNPAWCTPETGLSGINELLSGAILSFIGGVFEQKDRLSEIVAALRTEYDKDFGQTVDNFRRLIINSVRHKTRLFKHEFSIACSGGIDSSVAAIVANIIYPERPVTLINCYSEEDYHGDERFYFRLIAEKVKGKPIEVEINSLSSRYSLSPELLMPSPRPCKMSAAVGIQALLFRETAQSGCHMILTGDGGDQLFLKMNQTVIWKELLGRCFSALSFIKVISGLAIQQRRSFWSILHDTVNGRELARYRSHFFGEKRFPDSAFLNVTKPEKANMMPNEHALIDMQTSRLFQFYGMRNAEFNRLTIRGFDIQERKAFIFWPLIKASLQAPRIFHMADGNCRAAERYAFKNELPDEIFYRTSKGAGREILSRYDYKFIAECLVNGPVCRYGFVSSAILQKIIRRGADSDTAAALIRLSALNDWMMFYDK